VGKEERVALIKRVKLTLKFDEALERVCQTHTTSRAANAKKKCQKGRKSAQKVLGGPYFAIFNDSKCLYIWFLTFLVLSIIVLLHTKKEIIVKNNFIKLLNHEKYLFGPHKTSKGAACGPRAASLTCLH
jgi:hypothetical protein